MPATTLARLRTALPGARLLQTYGLTELGVFPTRSRSDDSLWLELGTPWKVVDGELWLKSPMAMLGYLNAPSPFDDDGWFATHDRVLVDGPFLRILGRESEVINVGGEKVDPVEVEAVLLEMDNVRDATVFARGNPVVGQVVAARLVLARPEDAAALRQRVRAFCAPRLPRHKIPVRIEIADRPDLGDRLKKVRRP
jgi:acyl-CoA synthetase (AMP-forming)/AMP-acid ligase II